MLGRMALHLWPVIVLCFLFIYLYHDCGLTFYTNTAKEMWSRCFTVAGWFQQTEQVFKKKRSKPSVTSQDRTVFNFCVKKCVCMCVCFACTSVWCSVCMGLCPRLHFCRASQYSCRSIYLFLSVSFSR